MQVASIKEPRSSGPPALLSHMHAALSLTSPSRTLFLFYSISLLSVWWATAAAPHPRLHSRMA